MKSIHSGFLVSLAAVGACGEPSPSVDFAGFVPKLSEAVPHRDPAPRRESSTDTPIDLPPHSPIGSAAHPGRAGVIVQNRELAKPSTYDQALAGARTFLRNGDTVSAKAMFETAIRFDAQRAEPHIELARLYISTSQRGMAMAEANKAVKLAPLSTQAWNTKGRAELHRFAYDEAIEAFSKAIEIDPGNVWAWNNLGYVELQLQHYDAAAEHLAEATARSGATGYMFNNLGIALEHLDRLDEARTAFDAGGILGSKEALSSRKRLQGVKSIALFTPKAGADAIEQGPNFSGDSQHTYDLHDDPAEDDHDSVETDPMGTENNEIEPEAVAAPDAAPNS